MEHVRSIWNGTPERTQWAPTSWTEMTPPSPVPHWDAEYWIFCFQKLSEQIIRDQTVSPHVLATLKRLCVRLTDQKTQFVAPNLTDSEEASLELNWLQLVRYTQTGSSVVASLKFCLVQIGHFLLATRRRSTDVTFATDVLYFSLDAFKSCLQEHLMEEAAWILDRSENLEALNSSDLPVETFDLLTQFLIVYRLIFSTWTDPVNNEAVCDLMKNARSQIVEPRFAAVLASISFNLGLKEYQKGYYELAIGWLEMSLAFKEKDIESDAKSGQKTLTLLASSYLKLDSNQSWKAIDALDVADETQTNLELRLAALLSSKNDTDLVECAIKYFQVLSQGDDAGLSVRVAVERTMALLEDTDRYEALLRLLDQIPWSGNLASPSEDQRDVIHVKWTCAKFALRCYSHELRFDDVYDVICELSQWPAATEENVRVIEEIAARAERIALKYRYEDNDPAMTHRWYDILVQLSTFHPVPKSVVWNAIKFHLSRGDWPTAQSYLQSIAESEETLEQLCIRLQVALLASDMMTAMEHTRKIDRIRSLAASWSPILNCFGSAVSTILECENRLDFLASYLESLLESSEPQNVLKCLALIFSLRIDLQRLRSCRDKNGPNLDPILEQIVIHLARAYDVLRVVDSRARFKIGPTRIDQWVASIAWNLGRQAVHSSSYRHHFFKFAYQFLSLSARDANADPIVFQRIQTAVTLSMQAALEHQEPAVLRSALETATHYAHRFPDKSALIHFMELDILCRLALPDRIQEKFDHIQQNPHQFGADFFQSLAAVASRSQFPGSKRMTIASLILALRATERGRPATPDQLVRIWRWLIAAQFEGLEWDETLTQEFQRLMEQLVSFVRDVRDQLPAADLFWLANQIWTSILLLRPHRDDLKRWAEFCRTLITSCPEVRARLEPQLNQFA